MATLTDAELHDISKELARRSPEVTWSKADIHAAIQVVEDWYEDDKTTVSSQIDTATSVGLFTNAQKKLIGALFMALKAPKEGA